MADQRIQYTEYMVGANHPTLADTLNRLTLVQHNTDGTHFANMSPTTATFTPLIFGSSANGVGTYSVQYGTYTKTGTRVNFECSLVWSAHTGTGNMQIILPFPLEANATNVAFASFADGISISAGSQIYVLGRGIGSNPGFARVFTINAGNASPLALPSSGVLNVSGSYVSA